MGRDSPHARPAAAAAAAAALLLLAVFSPLAAGAADSQAIYDMAKSVKNLPASWTGAGNVCNYEGIVCDGSHSGRVTSINLPKRGLQGTLPPSLSTLTALKQLQLQGNQLSGGLPSLAGFSDLTDLALDGNAFSSLPPDFLQGMPSLQALYLDDLPLAPWTVPDALLACSSIANFSASNASLTGTFPAVLANATSLIFLRLSYNNLTGPLPAGLAQLNALQTLQVNNMMLSGPIDVIANMTSIQVLWLHMNQFTGPIPDVSALNQLQVFNVRDNQLTGVVPPSLPALNTLTNVSLASNQFQGPMPKFPMNVAMDVSRFCHPAPGPCGPLATTLLQVAAGFAYPTQLVQNWIGNEPCTEPTWKGVLCVMGDVATLDFHNLGLTGTISPAIANLTNLQKLELSGNHITGVIPDVLTTMPNLVEVDVTNNSLTGDLPKFKPSVKVLADGNRFGESSGDSGGGGSLPSGSAGGGKSNAGMIIGILIALALLVACIGLLVIRRRRKNAAKFAPISAKTSPGESDVMKIQVVGQNGNSTTVAAERYSHVSSDSANIAHLFEASAMQFSMEVLMTATNNFDENCIIGKGGFGVVFKGHLNGKLVAVKRCDSGVMGTKGLEEFMAEIEVLRKVRHRHLVALLGYCTHGYERLLVYEYMSGGTLSEHLRDLQQSGYSPLTWAQRMTIALDVARGIEYLHGLAQETFIHRDLKPSNILLDQDLRAKVSDFGLVKLANDTDKSMLTRVAGTFGYLAPEYATTGKVTTKVDVYAYGVILMEMIAGRKVLDDSLPDDETHLVTIFRKNMLDKEKFRKLVDSSLELSPDSWDSLLEVADLARHCAAREPSQRPDMSHCVNRLSNLLDQWKPTDVDDDDYEGGSGGMGLHQQLEKWRCDDFTISDSDTSFSRFDMSRKPY